MDGTSPPPNQLIDATATTTATACAPRDSHGGIPYNSNILYINVYEARKLNMPQRGTTHPPPSNTVWSCWKPSRLVLDGPTKQTRGLSRVEHPKFVLRYLYGADQRIGGGGIEGDYLLPRHQYYENNTTLSLALLFLQRDY